MKSLDKIQAPKDQVKVEVMPYSQDPGKALIFFAKVSQSLSSGQSFSSIRDIEKFDATINIVHSKVKNNLLYQMTFWIPGTSNHELFLLIRGVTEKITLQKEEIIQKEENHQVYPYSFFKTSLEIIELCKKSYRQNKNKGNVLKDNCTILYFSEEENKIAASPDDFQFRRELTPFVINFKEDEELLKLVRVLEYPQILKSSLALYAEKHKMMLNANYEKIYKLLAVTKPLKVKSSKPALTYQLMLLVSNLLSCFFII